MCVAVFKEPLGGGGGGGGGKASSRAGKERRHKEIERGVGERRQRREKPERQDNREGLSDQERSQGGAAVKTSPLSKPRARARKSTHTREIEKEESRFRKRKKGREGKSFFQPRRAKEIRNREKPGDALPDREPRGQKRARSNKLRAFLPSPSLPPAKKPKKHPLQNPAAALTSKVKKKRRKEWFGG